MPDGSVMTESAAIILHLADIAPNAGLVPPSNHPQRPAFLRWLVFLVSAVYSTFTYGDDPKRWLGGDETAGKKLRESTDDHRELLWRHLEMQVGNPWFLGETWSALDIYLWQMQFWRPGRDWFAEFCPKLRARNIAPIQSLISGDHKKEEGTFIVSWGSLERRKDEYSDLVQKKIPANSKEIAIARCGMRWNDGDIRAVWTKTGVQVDHAPKDRVIGMSLRTLMRLGLAGAWTLLSATTFAADPNYRIETIAGNGMPGDSPERGGMAREVPIDLPFGVENGPDGALYITAIGCHRVLRVDRGSGRLIPVAGNGRRGYAGNGRPATEASLNEPYEVRFDSQGNMLILEMQNHVVRRVDSRTGLISTLSGDGVAGYRGDGGPALQARFRDPHSLILDEQDNIYVSDLSNHRVRRIDAKSGQIETVVGNGKDELPQDGGKATAQPFRTPQGLAVRGDFLWIASYRGHSVWRLDLKIGLIHRVAGTGRQGHAGDGGDPLKATFDGPRGLTFGSTGVLYIPDGENNVIRAIDTVRGSIQTIAGVGPERHLYAGDGVLATDAPLWQPHGVCVGADGSLVISDTMNHRVRLLRPIPRVP
jgi:hypothetical protein